MHSTRRRYVRWRYGDSLKFRYVLKTVKYGGFSILLWGAIKGDVTRILVRCQNRLNSEEYQRVLNKGLFEVYEASNIFITCHKSQSTMEFLDQKKVWIMHDWPPQSPQHNREFVGYFKITGLETIPEVDGWFMANCTRGMEGHLRWCHI